MGSTHQSFYSNAPFLQDGGHKTRRIITQLAHDVVTTFVFCCLLVATSDNVEATLSQRCLSDVVAPTKI